jgi:hypothetical protein
MGNLILMSLMLLMCGSPALVVVCVLCVLAGCDVF